MHRTQGHPTFYRSLRTLESATAFLLLFLLFVLGLFLLGNYQEFLDSTQRFVLAVLRVVSLLCALVGLYYTVGLIVWMARRGRFMLGRTILGAAALIFGAGLSLGVNLLLVVLAPVSGG
ncbi:hypothetical protein [Salinispira pacifica]